MILIPLAHVNSLLIYLRVRPALINRSGLGNGEMTSQAETLFSCRIVSTDYYLTHPVKDLDVRYSDLNSSAVDRVPVIRVFGATPAGQKCCVHVHGVFPYIHVPCPSSIPPDRSYLQQLARSIDAALHLSAGHVSSHQKHNHVYKIIVVKGL